MLDTQPEPTVVDEEALVAAAKADEQLRPDGELGDEDLGDEVIVEISVDGMCGVY